MKRLLVALLFGMIGLNSVGQVGKTYLIDPRPTRVVFGVGITLPAHSATAGTAPIKLTSGTAMTTPEDGAFEYHSSHLYFTIGSTRYQLDQQGGGGGGSLNSVGLTMPGGFSVSGSPLTSDGTLAVTTTLNGIITGNGSAFSAVTTSAGISGIISDETGSGAIVFGTSPTIVTPTIASFANANHNHSNSAGGGTIDHGVLTGLTDDDHNIYFYNNGRNGGQTAIGGTGTTDDLILRTTTGVGASGADIIFQGGNNGATEFARFLNSGFFGINTNSPSSRLEVMATGVGTTISLTNGISIGNTTDASSGNQQASGTLNIYSEAWKTNTTASSIVNGWAIYNLGIQGAANPDAQLVFAPHWSGTISSFLRVAFKAVNANNALTGLSIQGANGTELGALQVNGASGEVRVGATATSYFPTFFSNNSEVGRFITTGQFGVGVTAPTAWLHLKAGTASASQAPLKFASGTVQTTAEAGTVEYDGTNFYMSPSTTRKRIVLTNNATPSNGQIPIGNGTDYTVASILSGDGSVTITPGSGSINLAVTNPVTHGSYTPTLTNGTNVAASSAFAIRWSRTGDQVHVWGQIEIDPTSASVASTLTMSLPTGSNITDFEVPGDHPFVSGTMGVVGETGTGVVQAANGNNVVLLFTPSSTGAVIWKFHFTYLVVGAS